MKEGKVLFPSSRSLQMARQKHCELTQRTIVLACTRNTKKEETTVTWTVTETLD